jgi:hypothetical protein
MEQKAHFKDKKGDRVSAVFVGGNQIGRMNIEIGRMRGNGVKVERMIHMHGDMSSEAMNKVVMDGVPRCHGVWRAGQFASNA